MPPPTLTAAPVKVAIHGVVGSAAHVEFAAVQEAFTGVVVAVVQTPPAGVDAGTDEVVVQVHVGVAVEAVVQVHVGVAVEAVVQVHVGAAVEAVVQAHVGVAVEAVVPSSPVTVAVVAGPQAWPSSPNGPVRLTSTPPPFAGAMSVETGQPEATVPVVDELELELEVVETVLQPVVQVVAVIFSKEPSGMEDEVGMKVDDSGMKSRLRVVELEVVDTA
jgi:hypothetical protein